MTLALVFLDEQSVPRGGEAAPQASTFTPAVHHKIGVRQPDVPSHGSAGLAMWGWLRGVRFG